MTGRFDRATIDRGSLRLFLERASDVIAITDRVDGSSSGASLIVETDRHRVWLVHLSAAGPDSAPLRRELTAWCKERTLGDVSGRTFRLLLLGPTAFPLPASASGFEELAARLL